MTLTEAILLFGAGIISGSLNALAGGGSFVAFPALVFVGLLPIEANATATLAVWPGTLASMYVYRKELAVHKAKLPLFLAISLLGGLVGALILLQISNVTFANIVPYLLLVATLLFTFRTRLITSINKISAHIGHDSSSSGYFAFMMVLFFAVAVYGGFFGAGMGIMMLALFSLMGMHNMHEMNAVRSCSNLCANSIAIIMFVGSGIIMWPEALVMAVGGIIGGYFIASFALRLPQAWSRNAVIVIAWSMTLYFFWKQM